ncbi:unnamed protein product, partial [Iphiclides podalirius]
MSRDKGDPKMIIRSEYSSGLARETTGGYCQRTPQSRLQTEECKTLLWIEVHPALARSTMFIGVTSSLGNVNSHYDYLI